MKERKGRSDWAHIYPEGKETCAKCGDINLEGESFDLFFHYPYHVKHLCPACLDCETRKINLKQAASYASGKETPDYTSEVTCPWCGYEVSDSWELNDDGEHECDECGKDFSYSRHIEVTYCSRREIEDEAGREDD